MKSLNFVFLLGYILLFINGINATEDKNSVNKDNKISKSDKYYLIYVKNEHGEYRIFKSDDDDNNNNSNNKNQQNRKKREESQEYVESLLDELNTLIINNKDTYQHPEKLDEIEEASKLRKRSNEDDDSIYNYDETDFIRPIMSTNDTVIFYSYLSKAVAQQILKMPNVKGVEPNHPIYTNANTKHYNYNDIIKETGWDDFKARANADFHLSLISQGKYSHKFVGQYDSTYYYPTSAGEGTNIIVVDEYFDFNYPEFQNTNERESRCIAEVTNGIVRRSDKRSCGKLQNSNHGSLVIDIAAGIKHGVAPRANAYGISITMDYASTILALQYIYEVWNKPYTVINLSFGLYTDKLDQAYIDYENIINYLTKVGYIVVASAGNDSIRLRRYNSSYFIPCQIKKVICVGGIDNQSSLAKDGVYHIAPGSNYGDYVNIYSPYYVLGECKSCKADIVIGTSFSSPIVAGIIASMMSENPEKYYDYDTVLEQLIKQSKNELLYYEDQKGYIANNGKHIVYSSNGKYSGCGVYAGNRPCNGATPSNPNTGIPISTVSGRCGVSFGACAGVGYCCSQYGYCGKTEEHCGSGCQKHYGQCNSSNTGPVKPTTTTSKSKPVSTVSGRCGPSYGSCSNANDCCSQYGYCGNKEAYCGNGCQRGYGKCN